MTADMKMRATLLVIAQFLAASMFAADSTAIAKQANAWRAEHEHEILVEFADLLAIPNLASDTANIQRNASAIRALLEKHGLTAQLLMLDNAPPIVVADLRVP